VYGSSFFSVSVGLEKSTEKKGILKMVTDPRKKTLLHCMLHLKNSFHC